MLSAGEIASTVLKLEQIQAQCEQYVIGRTNELDNQAVDYADDAAAECRTLIRSLLKLKKELYSV